MELNASAGALSSAHPTRPIDWVTPSRRQAAWWRDAVYSLPRSEWKITPSTSPPRVAAAICSEAIVRSASWCCDIANPSSRRANMSSTVARYNGPSPVSICVTSPTHSRSGATAVKLRRTRSGAAARRPWRVSDRRLRGPGRPARPSSAIRAATVFSDTRQPSPRRSSVTRGDP
ncbi:Uncharacterised protein [Mycobacterium tuberculosis]|nr:Uncharacterised protein [Mycobacterium tuberculosis]